MTRLPTPRISSRKEPRQARSASLVADILEAAGRVLAEVGAQRFTAARVAERAGVSVGSLYQYFPNKAAILFRLQSDEWRETERLLRGILEDRAVPPHERLHSAVLAFVETECAEAEMRLALGDAAPLYRDAPEAEGPRLSGARGMRNFLKDALPGLPEAACAVAGDVMAAALDAVGERASEGARGEAAAAYAEALADMLCAYLERLGGRSDMRPMGGGGSS